MGLYQVLVEATILFPLYNRKGGIQGVHISDLNIAPVATDIFFLLLHEFVLPAARLQF